ncbi:type II toxin-antitoxin system VapC family toxin [Candidatus Shapirobacteria bacterium]|nr:type II toxin-antitoxin system VapC family toxin [Candidatus Shapirobacteria bacterium]
MKSYVLDASAVLAFLSEEKPSVVEKFAKILNEAKTGRAKLYSTHLLPLEIGNGLRFSLTDKELAGETFRKLFNLPIDLVAFSFPQLARILELSYHFQTSFYDTSYHLLAKLRKGTFLTGDAQYFKKAKGFGHIELL